MLVFRCRPAHALRATSTITAAPSLPSLPLPFPSLRFPSPLSRSISMSLISLPSVPPGPKPFANDPALMARHAHSSDWARCRSGHELPLCLQVSVATLPVAVPPAPRCPHTAALALLPVNFASLHCTALHFTSLHFASLRFTSLHFASLRFTSLHFTAPDDEALGATERERAALRICYEVGP